ncbi:MAG TPA: hypothetical protein VHQ90_05960 [Thermoanaerobaculia bacterium]|nr:hypothetical protein [Thermoanaerobaculia bacterium]
MKKTITAVTIALFVILSVVAFAQGGGGAHKGKGAGHHPRIHKAIVALEDAIDYMQKAPHDFGGHRAEAVEASKKAIEQLKLALAYDAGADKGKGKGKTGTR